MTLHTPSLTIKPHKSIPKFSHQSNQYLRLADAFLEAHPEILFWTERNETKKGLFYYYQEGVYKGISTLDIERMLMNFTPPDSDIVIPALLSHGKQQETMHFVKIRRFFYRDFFNPENIINFKNGLFDIHTGEMKPHTMDVISTNQLPYMYDAKAECPYFMKAMTEALENNLNKIAILQEYIGYCLTRSTKYEKGLFIIGASDSGKSTVLDGIEAMIGKENVSHTNMEQLCQARFGGNFIDKLVNIDHEIPKDLTGYEDVFKKIISGQAITVDTKFVPSYDAFPYCKVIFAANDMPKISDSSHAIFKRMLLLNFDNVISKEKMDFDLKEKIKKEAAGIFNWAFHGLQRLNENKKFTESMEMIDSLNDLKLQNNTVYYFINECFEIVPGEEHCIQVDLLYEKYQKFCYHVGGKGVFKKMVFSKEIKKIFGKQIVSGQQWVNQRNHRVWYGLKERNGIPTAKEAGVGEWNE